MPMVHLPTDLRHAFRTLLRRPMTTLLGILMLGLGIGLNTAIFSMLHGVLLKPLNVPESDRLMVVYLTIPEKHFFEGTLATGTFLELQERVGAFEKLVACWRKSFFWEGSQRSRDLRVFYASPGFLEAFGARIAVGRRFSRYELPNGRDPGGFVMMSEDMWRRDYGGDPTIVSRKIRLNEKDYPVMGVIPNPLGVLYGAGCDLWMPVDLSMERDKMGGGALLVYGWLSRNTTVEQAQHQLDALAASLAERFPNSHKNTGFRVVPAITLAVRAEQRSLLVLLQVAAVVVLLICAVNVSNLMVLRLSFSSRDLGVRSALGASLRRLLSLLLLQIGLMVGFGTLLGFLISGFVRRLLIGWFPSQLPRGDEIGLEPTVIGVALLSGLAVIVGCSVIPVLRLRKTPVTEALRRGSSFHTSKTGGWARSGLVALQLGLAVLLLVGSGLLVRTFYNLYQTDVGFDPDKLIVASVSLPTFRYREPERSLPVWRELIEASEELSGISQVGFSLMEPLGSTGLYYDYEVEGQQVIYVQKASINTASSGLFDALRLPLQAGRQFSNDDHKTSLEVVIVNEAFVGKHFPNKDAVGKVIKLQFRPVEIVGVVRDLRNAGLAEPARPAVYLPLTQSSRTWGHLILRSEQEPASMIRPVRELLESVNKDLQISYISSGEDIKERHLAPTRSVTFLLTLFATSALFLAAMGMFVVLAYSVQARTREIGIRLAVGASQGQIIRWILMQSLCVGGVGLVIGMISAVAGAQLLSSFLVGVGRSDPLALISASGILALIVFLASWIPAQRASRIDPIIALRQE